MKHWHYGAWLILRNDHATLARLGIDDAEMLRLHGMCDRDRERVLFGTTIRQRIEPNLFYVIGIVLLIEWLRAFL